MKLKLLICDDEMLIREGLASLDWDAHGLECVGTARNGEDALEKIEKLHPRIIISDVRMPKKDGIFLAEQVFKNYSNIRILFLSGYNEFEYAQKAIEYNVKEYLLKPINENELFEKIDRIRDEIIIHDSIQEKSRVLTDMMQNSRYFLKDYLFNLPRHDRTADTLFHITPDSRLFAACVLQLTDANNGILYMILEESSAVLSAEASLSFIPFLDGDKILFIFFTSSGEIKLTENQIFSACESIRTLLSEKYNNYDYNIGIGSLVPDTAELRNSYAGAVSALGYHKNLGYRQIIYINDVEPNSHISSGYSRITDLYIIAAKSCNLAEARKQIRKLFSAPESSPDIFYNQQRCCLRLILSLSEMLYEIGCNPQILFYETDVWSLIRRTSSSQELRLFIENITEVVISHIEAAQSARAQNLIIQVKALIETNLADDASLEKIASQVYLSPCYLSVIFKKETGVTFKNYLINARIEKSKELLSDTNLKIYEVAEKVGYADTKYFSELFQRLTGKTPSQYRNELALP